MNVMQQLEKIRKYSIAENYELAILELFPVLANPECPVEAYQLYALCLRMLDDHPSAEIIEMMLMVPDDPLNRLQLAFYFIKQGMFECALPQLLLCARSYPNDAIIRLNLGVVLLKLSRITDAITELEMAYKLNPDSMTAFYMSYALVLDNQLEDARKYSHHIKDKQKDWIANIIHRYETQSLPVTIRDWHYIQTGSYLLRCTEEAGNEFGSNNQQGLYTLLPLAEKRLIDTLSALQTLTGIFRDVIGKYTKVAFVGKRSQRLAEIYSEMRRLPIENVSKQLIDQGGVLIIAADTDEVEGKKDLFIGDDHNILFTLAHDWSRDGTIVPDIIGYMTQYSYLPWESTISFNEEGRLVETGNVSTSELINGNLLDQYMNDIDLKFIGQIVEYYEKRQNLFEVGAQRAGARKPYQRQSAIYAEKYL